MWVIKMKNKKIISWVIPIVIFLVALGIRFWGLNEHGQTWDEAAYYDGGVQYVANFAAGDFNPDHWNKNFEHPPVAKWVYGISNVILKDNGIIGLGKYAPGRIASACMGALTIVLVYFLVLEIFKSKRVAVLSSFILIFLPTFLAHNKVMGLETPSALFYTWAVYWFYIGLTRKRYFLILSAIPAALAIGTRFNNGHLMFFMATMILIYYFIPFKDLKNKKFPWIAVLIPIISLLIIWAIWPWYWGNIANHLDLNQRFLTTQLNSQADGAATDWFLGANVIPPWYYFIYYLFATTPLLILILLIVYFVKYFKNISFAGTYLLGWFLIFFVMSIVGFKQDGIRYIYPILVPMAIMAAYALDKLFKNSKFYIAASILIVYLIYLCVTYYPYYLDYYNELFGGVKGVYTHQTFEVGWWGEGLEISYEKINQKLVEGDSLLLLTCPDFSHGLIEKASYIKTYEDIEKNSYEQGKTFDYVITNPAFYWFKPIDKYVDIENYSVIDEIKVDGVPIVSIYQRNN